MTKQFTQEFKAEAVTKFLELKSAGKTIEEIEKELGVGNSSLYKWAERAKEQSRQVTRATMLPEAKLQTKPPIKTKGGQFPREVRDRALELLASGLRPHEVAKQLKIKPQTVAYWKATQQRQQAPQVVHVAPKHTNGIGSGGAITDALIYLRHAEKEILDMVREGKISRPDQAHLLTLLALGSLQKSIAK